VSAAIDQGRRATAAPRLTTLASHARFAACVAHELRTPLATQRAILELSLADPSANWREIAESVLRACGQQERLLEACLSFARIQGGPVRSGQVDLAEILADALRTHDTGGIESVVSLEPARTAGDPALIERLAANLVSNAIRHNVQGGRIELATYTRSERAVLVVANTGPFVPAADLRRLFQPFQRLSSSRRSSGDGVGLGLAIVEAIATVHGAGLAAKARPGGGLEIRASFRAIRGRRPALRDQL